MKFARVVFVAYSCPEEARAQVSSIRAKNPKLSYHGQPIYVDLDRGPEARRRGWVLRELRRSLSSAYSPESIVIDYAPGILYVNKEVGYYIRGVRKAGMNHAKCQGNRATCLLFRA